MRRLLTASALTMLLLPGTASTAAAEVTTALPPADSTIRLAQRVGGAQARACARPCERMTLDRVRAEVALGPSGTGAAREIELRLLFRAPGRSQFRSGGVVHLVADATGRARIPLVRTPIARRAGTWCLRATVAATTQLTAATSRRSCVRYRPPITIGWAGDTVLGSRAYGLPPQHGARMFDRVLPMLRTPDLMIGNYEGTLSRGGTPRCGGGGLCYIFQAPPANARALARAGFDVMSLANNHGLDMGVGARAQTVRALRAAGVRASGLPGRVSVHQIADTRVAVVGMSPYPGTTSMRDLPAVRELVTRARRSADIVVMTMHVGLEGPAGAHVPRGADYGTNTRASAHAAIDAGADVVVGSGPHVVRGVEHYRGRFVVYSTGNFAGWRNFGRSGLTAQSGVVTFTMDAHGSTLRARWRGVRLVGPGIPVPDASIVRRVRALSVSDFGRNAAHFMPGGYFR